MESFLSVESIECIRQLENGNKRIEIGDSRRTCNSKNYEERLGCCVQPKLIEAIVSDFPFLVFTV